MGDVRAACTVAILVTVPIPDGPASLGLPALSTGTSVNTPGATRRRPTVTAATTHDTRRHARRARPGGGYRGFSETLDTSVRGDLGDEIVMRVRSPEPAFWRGQTFTDFDGRTWTVSPELGRVAAGPEHRRPADARRRVEPDLESDELIQTYFVEADLPNVLFAAHRATHGHLRRHGVDPTRRCTSVGRHPRPTDRCTPSCRDRVRVTPDLLRSQGDVAEVFATLRRRRVAGEVLAPYLERPGVDLGADARRWPTHSTRTGESTYDTVLAYEAWLGANTTYDLNAPVPASRVPTPSTTSCSTRSAGSASRSPARSR